MLLYFWYRRFLYWYSKISYNKGSQVFHQYHNDCTVKLVSTVVVPTFTRETFDRCNNIAVRVEPEAPEIHCIRNISVTKTVFSVIC